MRRSFLDENYLQSYHSKLHSNHSNPNSLQSLRISNFVHHTPKLESLHLLKQKKIYHNGQKSVQDDCLHKTFKYSSSNSSPLQYNLFSTYNKKLKVKHRTKYPKKDQNSDLWNGVLSQKRFKFIYQIGFGGFGRVWKVYDRSGEKDYAMKQISKKKVMDKNSIENIMNERKVLALLEHQFLVNIHQAFQDEHNLYLVMDYLRGADLRYHICYKQTFSQNECRFIISCILVALEYIHSKKIIHRDIKPENLIFEDNGYLRMTDFGIAIFYDELNIPFNDTSGTPGYMAPEILFKKQYSLASDFFAIGVIAYQLLIGNRPYEGKNRKQIKEQMQSTQIFIDQQKFKSCWSSQSIDFINRLLVKEPKQRLGGKGGIKELKKHKWLKNIDWSKLEKKKMKPPFVPNVISETKDYLDEISMYNEMQETKKENQMIPEIVQKTFRGYEYFRGKKSLQPQYKSKKMKKSSHQRKYIL